MKKSLEGIDQVQGNLKDNIQDFAEGMNKPNRPFPWKTECEKKSLDNQYELLQCQYRINHLSLKKLKTLSTVGMFPRRLCNVQPPKFPA